MKKLLTLLFRILPVLFVALTLNMANAQMNYAPLANEDFSLTVQNFTQTAPNKIEFDVYLLDSDPGQPFELASTQLGFLFNSGIWTGGTITAAIDNTNSGLIPAQQFTAAASLVTTLAGYPNLTLLRMAGKVPPGAGNGTIISQTGFGTLLTHFSVTCSVPWVANTTANFIFNSNTVTIPLYATRVAAYLGTVNTQLAVNPGVNALICCNPVLNQTAPTAFAVNGAGSYCEATGGLPVGLDNSETGVTYTLLKDGAPTLPTVTGNTGTAITFGNQLAGTYTVSGTNDISTTAMTGSAVIAETPAVAISVSIVSDVNNICSGTTATFTATPVGDLTPAYQWYVNTVAVGANQATYSYAPANGDLVYVAVTSSLPCAIPSPATSNTITMDVTPSVAASVSIGASQNNVCTGTSVTFTATPVGGGTTPTYQWYKNTVAVATGDTYTYVPLNGDIVYVVMTSNAVCVTGSPATSNSVTMIVNPYVAASVTAGASQNNICAGTSVTFTATPVGGGTTPTYQWYKNTVAAATGATYTYAPVNGDVVYVVMTSNAPCVTGSPATSNSVTMVVGAFPSAATAINGPTVICSGATGIGYDVAAIAGADSYVWTLPVGATIASGSGTHAITVDFALNAVSGNITVAGHNTCGNGTVSPAKAITVNTKPATPVITKDFKTLTSSAATGNQWYRDGVLITGATAQTYEVTVNATYYTIVTINGCASDPSNSINVVDVNIANPTTGQFEIFPIPSDGLFTATLAWPTSQMFNIQVYNNIGSLVFEKKDIPVNGTSKQTIDMRPVPSGMYTVIFTSGVNQVIRKMMVNRK